MTKITKAVAGTIAGAVTTVVLALFPDIDPKLVGAGGTILTALIVYFSPKNAE